MTLPTARVSLVTLGVADVAAATQFYEALGWLKAPQSVDTTAFMQGANLVLALVEARGHDCRWRRRRIAARLRLARRSRSTLRIQAAVDEFYARAVEAGARAGQAAGQGFLGRLQRQFSRPRRVICGKSRTIRSSPWTITGGWTCSGERHEKRIAQMGRLRPDAADQPGGRLPDRRPRRDLRRRKPVAARPISSSTAPSAPATDIGFTLFYATNFIFTGLVGGGRVPLRPVQHRRRGSGLCRRLRRRARLPDARRLAALVR